MLVYVVNGSEDGLLGIFSSVEKAYKRAAGYVKEYGFKPETATVPTLQRTKQTLRLGSGKYGMDFSASSESRATTAEIRVMEVE